MHENFNVIHEEEFYKPKTFKCCEKRMQQQHSFQTVYKKIKSQSNNPCACQDRTKQTKTSESRSVHTEDLLESD